MPKLTHEKLFSLEHYARVRSQFRDQVMAHKKDRRLAFGDHAALYFEDALTMKYQVQEMLRLERIFEPDLIQAELDVYNPLIPDGQNWKATFMIEYADPKERHTALAKLTGIEDKVWVSVKGHKVYAIANEDIPRSRADKTAAVHFLRFEFPLEICGDIKAGAPITAGIDHPAYKIEVVMPENVRNSLAADLTFVP